jgi:poly(hydroxyalkanoate) depolymerase family esterase
MVRMLPAIAAALLALVPGTAVAAGPDPPDPGESSNGTVTSNGNEYPYIRYTPTTYSPGRAAPLLVMVHGCQTTAAQELKITLFDKIAEREGFVVLYPEVDAIGRAQQGPTANCWKFTDPSAYFRDNSDGAAIADMTRAVMKSRNIDPERVYVVGVSAGGLMASAVAASYADLYAAVGIVESAGYADGTCFTNGVGNPVEANAALARQAMGPYARVVPRFVITSDGDLAFPANCGIKALDQGLRTNNLVLGDDQTRPISLVAAEQHEQQNPGGYGYSVATFRDPAGCLIGERWIIHGMPHAWPGGTSDSNYAGYSDPKAPDGAEGSWAFLKRYAKSATAPPCSEAQGSGASTGPLIVNGCLNTDAKATGKKLGPARLGRKRNAQRKIFNGAKLKARKGLDRYCAVGGGAFRIGYPPQKLLTAARKRLARKIKGRVVLILTSSKRFKVKGIRTGDRSRKVHGKHIKVGRNTWYLLKRRKGVRQLLVVRRGKVRAVGIGDSRLTKTKRLTRRYLNAWKLGV